MQPMRLARLVLALSLLLCGWAGTARAQGATTGGIRGEVTSAEGRPVAGAQVAAVNEETGLRRSVVSGEDGRYTIPLLPPGRYRVEAQGLGLAAAARPAIPVRLNEVTPVNFTLAAEAVALEGITVSGGTARVDPTQGGVVQTITPEQVENLPVQGRDFTDFLNLSPLVSPQPGVGTGGQFAIGGARTSGTNVQIDGTDANNVFFGENRGSSRTPFAFSLESIREFQLITNGFDVEYGNYQGGVVNAVTRGGTNEFRGSAFAFFRDQSLTGEDFNGQPAEEYQVQQFGLSLSGPILRDRLHFFASVDAQNKDQPIFALTPEASEIPQPVIDQFGQVLGQLGFPNSSSVIGQTTQAEDNLVLFGRLDWTINDDHRLTLRQNYSDFEQTNDRITANETLTRGGPFVNKSNSTVLELNSVFGSSAFNTFRFQYSDEDRPRNPNQPGGYLPEFRLDDVSGTLDIFTGGDAVIFRNRLQEDKLQFIDNFTFQAGAHTFKVGTNNLISNTVNTFYNQGNGAFRFGPTRNAAGQVTATTLENFLAGRPNQYTRNVRACPAPLTRLASGNLVCSELDVPVAEFSYLEWSLYAQDEWQVTDRFRVTPGIRVGGTTFRDEPAPVASVEAAFRDPLTGEAVQSDLVPDFTGVSPRLSMTYDLRGDQTNVLRAGAGLLIGRAPTVLAGNVFQTERPLLSVLCTGSAIPAFNLQELLAAPRGENNPAACASGSAPGGRPEHSLFSTDFELPQTLKANVGYTTVLPTGTNLNLDFIYSRSENNFTVRDLNLKPQQFTLGVENRPVFVPVASYAPTSSAGVPRLANSAFDRVFLNTSEGEARSYSFTVELDQRVGENFQLGVSYGHVRAYDNGSFSCCTSFEGFNEVTAGDPNFTGDPGDEEAYWGPSEFERRHTFVANFLWNAPFGFNLSGIWRSTSGTPWTPIVDDDINGDGIFGNDRAYVGTDLAFASPAEQAQFEELLDSNECLREQLGRIVTRNSCRNPWFHSLDLRVAKELRTLPGQSAEFVVDVFNVLNGLNSDWGQWMGVFGNNQELLDVARYDAAAGRNVYNVNETFGDTDPLGFDPFQFQVQLGVRYRF